MDKYENQILDLAQKITEKETGNIRSVIGIMNIIYGLVEEITRRNKKKLKNEGLLSEAFKKEISIRVIKGVVEILYDKELIDYNLYEAIIENINTENLNIFLEFIEDITEIWNSELLNGCICRRKEKKNVFRKIKA